VKRLYPRFFFFAGVLNVSMYFDRHGDHILFIGYPVDPDEIQTKRLDSEAQTPT